MKDFPSSIADERFNKVKEGIGDRSTLGEQLLLRGIHYV
jgi:hypothetical protein